MSIYMDFVYTNRRIYDEHFINNIAIHYITIDNVVNIEKNGFISIKMKTKLMKSMWLFWNRKSLSGFTKCSSVVILG